MTKTETAKRYLAERAAEIDAIRADIERTHERLERIMSRLIGGSAGAMDGGPHGHGDADKLTDGISMAAELRSKINMSKTDLKAKRRALTEDIRGAVANEKKARVLALRYAGRYGWDRIAEEMQTTKAYVWRMHGAALEELGRTIKE